MQLAIVKETKKKTNNKIHTQKNQKQKRNKEMLFFFAAGIIVVAVDVFLLTCRFFLFFLSSLLRLFWRIRFSLCKQEYKKKKKMAAFITKHIHTNYDEPRKKKQ